MDVRFESCKLCNLFEQEEFLITTAFYELVSDDNDFAANILVLRAGSVGFTEVEPSGSKSSGVEVRLPCFELPKFDGDVTRFREFWDQFEASVHQQTDLCDATKMAYLRGCLTGVALDALQGLSAANQRYEIAVQRLKGRFDRSQVALRLEDKRLENASEKQGSSGKGRETQKTVAFFHSAVEAVYGFCQKQHTIAECASLKQASRQKQREMATRYRLCFYCLKPGHVSSACKSDRRRKSPASKDSSAVVSVGTTTTERVQETPTVECKSSSVSMIYANLASEKRGRINRFQTIKARAFGDAGSGITVTCLLDTGAEYSFIREDVASALGVVGRAQPVKVEGFGGATHEHPSSQVVQLWLCRLDGSQNAERYLLEALTVPSLCHRIPVSKILTSEWEHLQFFDPVIDDESSDEVHVVIGIDYYYRFLGHAIRRGKSGDPVAVETVLGWIICGPVNPHPAPETVAAFSAVVEPKVEDLLRIFWEIEGMGVPFRSESDEVELQWRVWKAYFPFSPAEASRLELHGFGDASEAAYAAVVYLRAVKTPDDVQVSFVTAKSRVAPLKKLSTPRLELMVALLCARLVCHVRKELALDVEACHCWSDNKVTVSPPQDAANVINPGRYSSFERLIRVTAWCRRFRHSTTLPASSRRTGTGLTSDELKEAERIWIRQEQIHAFSSKKSLDKAMTKMLCGLNPFLDEFGILRVGGRLGRVQLEEETKFPALLLRKGMIVDLLIRREHNRQLHAGVAQTLTALRERFWILRGRSAVKPAICLTVEDDQLIHLAQLETAREMWQTLQRFHERASIGSKLYLMRKLYGMRFTHGTMQSHINGILEIVTQLRGLSKNIEDEDLVPIMLCSLPDSYSALVTALEGRDEADLTVEYSFKSNPDKVRQPEPKMLLLWQKGAYQSKQPPGFEDTNNDMVWQLKRSIYGLKQSARAWNTKAREILTTVGFRQAKADLCLYTRKEPSRSMTYVLLYVDDLLIAAENEAVALTINKQLSKYIEVKDLGEVSYYLGIQIERKLDGTFLIHQKNKIMQLLESCSMQEAKPVATPMETNYLSSLDEPSPALPDKTKYRYIIGSLLHISNVTGPDIALSVGLLCRKMETPTERNWKSAKRIIRYLAGTANAKLCLSSTNDLILRGHVDADWAGEKSSRKSTSGYVFQLGHGTIAWSTKRQTIVALSTTEAEYVALAEASRELLWLRQLLNDFRVQTPDATTLYEDNQGCIRLVESDRFGERTKHINVRFHMVKDLREKGILEVKYCLLEEMIADNLTKPVCKQQIENFTENVVLEDYGQENEKGCWEKHSPDL
ncbi:Retrovirus-related Pol polyprotein from transposon TNT 1-94 [Trichinella spiralis]|uniref:Retrovirus-related Pol polyprotein from transposon TNT 1-94 n=1 Tax=Trichinella spiralis TaxID=6334 RepID=A0A0V1BP50_TRISP|nr:Retrovirus-related Pol polyprotein from transposon TNT 1-94 [Trichinella spiralis]